MPFRLLVVFTLTFTISACGHHAHTHSALTEIAEEQRALTKALAEELAPHNIYVNAVAPGYFETSMVKDRISDKKTMEKILSFTPLKRLGSASDIISPVLFFASDASDFITGQTLFVDGGRTAL